MSHKPSKRGSIPQPTKMRRHWSLKVISWIFILWMVLGWLRLIRTLADWQLLLSFLSSGLVVYLAAAGMFWGLVSLPALYAIIRRPIWATKAIWAAALAIPAVYWLERLFLWQDPFAQRNWPFMLLLTLIWLSWVGISLQSKQVKRFFNPLNVEG